VRRAGARDPPVAVEHVRTRRRLAPRDLPSSDARAHRPLPVDADAALAPAQVCDRGRAVRARRHVGAWAGRRRGDAGHRRPHHADLDDAPARLPFGGAESRAAGSGRQDRGRDPLDRGDGTDWLICQRCRTVQGERVVYWRWRCVMMRARPFRQENAMSEFPECLLIVTAEVDAAVEAEWNRWYDTVHLPDALRCPGVQRGRRYVSSGEITE